MARALSAPLLVILLLLSWIATSSAATFHSETPHTTITGSQSTTLTLATDPGTTHCKNATFTATAEGTSFESFTATPIQSECTLAMIFGNIAVTTNFNGCDYVFAASGSFQIKCPEGKSVVISGPGCTITVPAQSVATGLTYGSTGTGASRDLDIAFNLSGLAYSYSGFTCGSGSGTTNGTLNGAMTAVGECPDGSQVGIWSGGGKEPDECPPVFNSETPHTTITGAQTTLLLLTIDSAAFHCQSATFTATAESRSFGSMTVTPTHSFCTLTRSNGNIAVTTNLNGCDYVFAASGAFQIKCPEGKSITISAPGCTLNIPAQSLASGIIYTNEGSGSSRDLNLHLNLSGLAYSTAGLVCGTSTGTTNGTWTGRITLQGENGEGKPVGIWQG